MRNDVVSGSKFVVDTGLDLEWIYLIKEAKEIGLSTKEVSHFLQTASKNRVVHYNLKENQLSGKLVNYAKLTGSHDLAQIHDR